MLRISTATQAGSLTRLTAEGAIAGDWVPLLEAECLGHLTARRRVELDVAGVSFVDRAGVVMVRDLVDRGVQVVGASASVGALLQRPAGLRSQE